MTLHEAVGCIHIHSTFSDGSGDVPDLIEAAEQAGLDFIILTDHNTLRPKTRGLEGWHGKVLLIVGEEVGWNRAHILSIGARRHVKARHGDPVEYIRRITDEGGLSFIVHPDGKPKPQFGINDTRWKMRGPLGLTGLEIWSYMYDWIDRVQWWNLPWKLFRPNRALRGPKPETLRTWDRLCREQSVVGITGVDAHAKKMLPGLEVFPYRAMFSTLRNHLLLDRPFSGSLNQDKQLILDALRSGRCFFANDLPHNSTGFGFRANYADCDYQMGDHLRLSNDGEVRFEGASPIPARSVLLRDGISCYETKNIVWQFANREPGVYRVEVRTLENQPWIYSNPICVSLSDV